MLRSVCCSPSTQWRRIRHAGKVKVSPNRGCLPGSACSPAKTQIWVQAPQFAKLCRLSPISGGNSPWFSGWFLLFLEPMSWLYLEPGLEGVFQCYIQRFKRGRYFILQKASTFVVNHTHTHPQETPLQEISPFQDLPPSKTQLIC